MEILPQIPMLNYHPEQSLLASGSRVARGYCRVCFDSTVSQCVYLMKTMSSVVGEFVRSALAEVAMNDVQMTSLERCRGGHGHLYIN